MAQSAVLRHLERRASTLIQWPGYVRGRGPWPAPSPRGPFCSSACTSGRCSGRPHQADPQHRQSHPDPKERGLTPPSAGPESMTKPLPAAPPGQLRWQTPTHPLPSEKARPAQRHPGGPRCLSRDSQSRDPRPVGRARLLPPCCLDVPGKPGLAAPLSTTSPGSPAPVHLPADHVTIWYTVTPHHGQEVIAIQLVRPDT